MIKGKKALFSMIVSAAFMASSIATPVHAIKNETASSSKKQPLWKYLEHQILTLELDQAQNTLQWEN